MGQRQRKICSTDEAISLVLGSPEATMELALARLWRHWPEVLGKSVAAMVRPLGHRKATLLLGAENSLVIQEFSFFAPQILEKANAFLGTRFFQEVHIELSGGRPTLDQPLLPAAPAGAVPPRPAPLGNLLPCLPSLSPVANCYRAYVKRFIPEMDTGEDACDSHDS